MSWLSPADQQVVQVAKLIANKGLSFIEACTQAGVQWSPKTFGTNVNRLLTNPALRNALGSGARQVLSNSVRAVGGEALAAVGANALAGGATLIAGISTAALLTGAAVLVGAGLAVGYVWSQGDAPVLAGPNSSGVHVQNVQPFDADPSQRGDVYYIWSVQTSGASLYIGRTNDVVGRKASSFPDGGTGDNPVDWKKLVETPFKTADEARAYLKANVSTGHHSVWTGQWVKFQGVEYRTVHVSGL